MESKAKDHYISQYKELQAVLPGKDLSWLNQAREEALASFSKSGFPSPREEDWRYTNVAPIERKLFSPSTGVSETVDRDTLKQFLVDGAVRLVFVDGRFSSELSLLSEVGDRILICSMTEALEKHSECIKDHFGVVTKKESNGFLAFNAAFFTDGCFVYVPASIKVDRPIQFLFLSSCADGLSNTRNLVIAEPHAQVEIIESHVGLGDFGYLTGAVSEVTLAHNANVSWTKLQCEGDRGYHFGGVYADVGSKACLEHANFSFGGLLTRNEVHADLSEAAECSLDGLFLVSGRQHTDHHTRLRHLEPHGISREFYKGILDQRARGVFQGRIIVDQDAQKTDSAMSNRNLLLSDDAEIDTKPQLEIYADDVKCAHGVTVGQLEEESVFYLQSRGVDERSARNMLTFAFANEMVEKIQTQGLRSLIQNELLSGLPQADIRKEWL